MPKNIEKEPFKLSLTRILRLYWLFVVFLIHKNFRLRQDFQCFQVQICRCQTVQDTATRALQALRQAPLCAGHDVCNVHVCHYKVCTRYVQSIAWDNAPHQVFAGGAGSQESQECHTWTWKDQERHRQWQRHSSWKKHCTLMWKPCGNHVETHVRPRP